MEPCNNRGAAEDPDSRDSGISVGCAAYSQGALIADGIDGVHISDEEEQHNKENYDHFEENAVDGIGVFRHLQQRDHRSPRKKRMRQEVARDDQQRSPTDFSFMCAAQRNSQVESIEWDTPPSRRQLQRHFSQPENRPPFSESLSQDSSGTLLFQSPSCSVNSSNRLPNPDASNDPSLHNSCCFVSPAPGKGIPGCARSIHRVHSSSALECSRDKSWGSPDAFEHYSLITVERPQVPDRAFRSIDADTLAQLLGSLTEEQFTKRFILIDCRYPYEFSGGHIKYSVNVNKEQELEAIFYPEDGQAFDEINARIPIFYCEFSQKRGPKMARELRKQDRIKNETRYPYVDYKEIYLLDRGYRHFFKERQLTVHCTPEAYVQMWDPEFAVERNKFDSHRRRVKKRQMAGGNM